MLTAKDPMIDTNSKYYNIAPDGTYTDNPAGCKRSLANSAIRSPALQSAG
jgi:hypothetical protein